MQSKRAWWWAAACAMVLVGCDPALHLADGGVGVDVVHADVAMDHVDASHTDGGGMDADVVQDSGINCPAAVGRALSLPDTVHGSLMGTGHNPNVSCIAALRATADGPDEFYTLQITTRTGVSFTLTGTDPNPPDGSIPRIPVLAVRRVCDDMTTELGCAVDADPMAGGKVRLVLDPGLYFVVVDEVSGGAPPSPVPYTLTVTPFMPASNATCTTATAITSGATVNGLSTAGGTGGLECGNSSDSRVWYSLLIPPNSRMSLGASLAATAPDGGQLSLQVFDACDATMCVASTTSGTAPADGGMVAAADAVVDNHGTTARRIYVAVGNVGASPSTLPFSLSSTVVPFPYIESTVPPSCDDMTTATAIAPVYNGMAQPWGDDIASPIQALPFPFNHFGLVANFYSVTSNGYMQLWATATGVPGTAYSNTPLPSMSAPPSMIAPFWDDLLPLYSAGTNLSDVRVGTFSTGGTHFTIQWGHWVRYSDALSRLTFQVKLFQTSNAVEFHYCVLQRDTGTDDAGMVAEPDAITGSSATVGMQNAAATDGVQHSYDTAGQVMTSMAIRYVPN